MRADVNRSDDFLYRKANCIYSRALAYSQIRHCRVVWFVADSEMHMKWVTPVAIVVRLGMEINSYVANR